MTEQEKINLLSKLVKEGHITLNEAWELSQPKIVPVTFNNFEIYGPPKPNLNSLSLKPYTPTPLEYEQFKI